MNDQTLKDIDRAFKALEERGELLDKIRAEIDENLVHDDWDFGQEIYYNSAINDVLQIIDKYKAEKEELHGRTN